MANSSAKEKPDKQHPDYGCTEKLDWVNYCVPGMLSRCGAGPNLHEQKKCRYYKKATIRDRCMHYIVALNGHCDCVDAQREVRRQKDCQKYANSNDNGLLTETYGTKK